MKTMRIRRGMSAIAAASVVALFAASCTPPPAPTGQNWSVKATNVTVNNSQDETCVLICVNKEDEVYVLNIGWRVKIGQPGSASSSVTGSRSNDIGGLGAGDSATMIGASQSKYTFGNVKALDILDLADANNKLEVFGTYSWMMEKDLIGVGVAANDVSDVLEDALNATLAAGAIPQDLNFLLDLIFDNLFNAFTLLLQNIPLLGLGDDALGGKFYVGIGAKGALGSLVDTAIGSFVFPSFPIPVASLPPDVQGGGLFTMTGDKTFTNQTVSGAGGQHTYTMVAGPA